MWLHNDRPGVPVHSGDPRSQHLRGRIMARKLSAIALLLLFIGGLLTTPALAGVPRTIIAEDFGATW
jgi:hypothetical protein